MLNEFLKEPVSRESALYSIGRLLGIFPKNSFEQYKYLLDDESENAVNNLLTSVFRQLCSEGMIVSVNEDQVQWNERFKVDTFLEAKKKKKEDRAFFAQQRAKAKSILRKSVSIGQTFKDSAPDGLVVKVTAVDLDLLSIETLVQQVGGENTKPNVIDATAKGIAERGWSHVFVVGKKAIWKFNSITGGGSDLLVIFEADAHLETGTHAQSLLYINNGSVIMERDS